MTRTTAATKGRGLIMTQTAPSGPVGIPQAYLDRLSKSLSNATANASNASTAPANQIVWNAPIPTPSIQTTWAQDSLRCPLIKLPQNVSLISNGSWAGGLSGVWRSSDNSMTFASWQQNHLTLNRNGRKLYVYDLDRRLSLVSRPTTVGELETDSGFRVLEPPESLPALSSIIADWADARGEVRVVAPTQPGSFAVQDCVGRLLFVVSLIDLVARPGEVAVYDSSGGLAAYGIPDPLIGSYQFVDSQGYQLALAQLPSFGNRASMIESLPSGSILPYDISFRPGGYSNSSRLLESSFRWVLAAALQLRAVQDAKAGWAPQAAALTRRYVIGFSVAAAVLLLCCCGALCRWGCRRHEPKPQAALATLPAMTPGSQVLNLSGRVFQPQRRQ